MGLIGQNLSYQKSFSRDKIRGNIVKNAELPVVQPDGSVKQTFITEGDPEGFNGTYLVDCDVPFKSISGSPVTIAPDRKSILMRAQPGQTAQMHLQFDIAPARLKILRPGMGDELNPRFIGFLQALNASILRFMDYGRINGNEITDKGIELSADLYGEEGKGGPPEEFLMICKATGALPWMNFPHGCTDVYVHWIGSLLQKYQMESVYVEWSNEVWNTASDIGKNTAYAKAKGKETWPDETNTVRAARRYLAKRSVEIKKILDGYCADVRLVIAGQAANPDVNQMSVDQLVNDGTMDHVYGFAISPYWGSSDYVKYMPEGPINLEYFFNQGYRFGDVTARKGDGTPTAWGNFRTEPGVYIMDRAVGFLQSQKFQDHVNLCKKYGKAIMAYEGQGPAISSTLFKQLGLSPLLNGDARILPSIEAHNKLWFDAGGGEYMHFPAVALWKESTYAASDRIEVLGPKATKLAEISSRYPLKTIDPEVFKLRKELKAIQSALDSANQTMLTLSDQVVQSKIKVDQARELGKQLSEL